MIKIYDDGKEKPWSFTAYINRMDYHAEIGNEFTVSGSGATEEEALLNLQKGLNTLAEQVQNLRVDNIEKEYVDYKGDKI